MAEADGDALIACLAQLTRRFDRPRSAAAIRAGLPDPSAPMSPALFVRAAAQAGLSAQVVEAPDPAKIETPAVVALRDGGAVICERIAGGEAEILSPSGKRRGVSLRQLRRVAGGYAITVSPARGADGAAETTVADSAEAWLSAALRPYLWTYAQGALGALMINLFQLAAPIFIMAVYDRVVPTMALDTLTALAIGVSVVVLFDLLVRTARGYLIDVAGRGADEALAARLFDRILDMRLAARPSSSGAFANAAREYETLREALTAATLVSLVDAPFILLFVAAIALIGGPLAIVPVVAAVLIVGLGVAMHWPLARAARRAHEDGAMKHGVLVETLAGLETLKAAGAQGRMRGRWETATRFAGEAAARSRFLSGLAVNGAHFVQQAATIVVVGFGVLQIADGAMSAGALIACIILTSRAMAPLAQIANLLTRLHQALQAYRTVDRLMRAPTERPPGRSFLQRGRFAGAIAFDDVSFTYPEQSGKALDRVRFAIEPGMRVGVLGRVGSGKSTLHRLILGLYPPDDGAIRIDGVDLRQIDPLDLRQAVGHVAQDVVLFRGSLRDNIALAAPEADDAAILRAAEAAGVDDFAARHPRGYDLPIGERGEGLSGGQKQAVALARALLRDPPILLLDEPTTGFDIPGEARFRSRMGKLATGKTVMMVTHRNALLTLFNQLMVMDQGRLAGFGERDAILAQLTGGRAQGASA